MDRTIEHQPSESLNFVDADHVLVTFNRKALIKRLPECTPDHEDRLMHAAILEIPSGKVVKETDWFLHDRRRHLWPLAPGKFLLRRWNTLYVVDSNLGERLLLNSPKNLVWVSVTPDGSQVIVETENDKKPDASKSKSSPKSQPKYVVKFLDVKTLAPQRTLLFNNLTNVGRHQFGVRRCHSQRRYLAAAFRTYGRQATQSRSRPLTDCSGGDVSHREFLTHRSLRNGRVQTTVLRPLR